jgi:hypothetical protein
MIPSFVKVQQDGDAESLSGLLSCFVKNRMGRDFLCIRRGAAKLPLCHYGFFSYKKNRMGRDYPQLCWGSTAWLRRNLMPLIAAWSSN